MFFDVNTTSYKKVLSEVTLASPPVTAELTRLVSEARDAYYPDLPIDSLKAIEKGRGKNPPPETTTPSAKQLREEGRGSKEFSQALQFYAQAIPLYIEGGELENANRTAIEIYILATEMDPSHGKISQKEADVLCDLLILVAETWESRENWTNAIIIYKKTLSVTFRPTVFKIAIRSRMAELYRKLGNHQKAAISMMTVASDLPPASAKAAACYLKAADFFEDGGNLFGQLRALTRARDTFVRLIERSFASSAELKNNWYKDLLETCKTIQVVFRDLSHKLQTPEDIIACSNMLTKDGGLSSTSAKADKILATSMSIISRDTYERLAGIYMDAADYEQAMIFYELLIVTYPNSTKAPFYTSRHRVTTILVALQRAIKMERAGELIYAVDTYFELAKLIAKRLKDYQKSEDYADGSNDLRNRNDSYTLTSIHKFILRRGEYLAAWMAERGLAEEGERPSLNFFSSRNQIRKQVPSGELDALLTEMALDANFRSLSLEERRRLVRDYYPIWLSSKKESFLYWLSLRLQREGFVIKIANLVPTVFEEGRTGFEIMAPAIKKAK